MARRSIAKTAIEGGRMGVCRDLERLEDRYNRREWRRYCYNSLRDEDAREPVTEHLIGGFDRYREGRQFADKLNPVRKWLAAQVGRKWDAVKSDVTAKFDSRSLEGRHILDHVKHYVELPWDSSNVASGLVDEDGVRKQPKYRWSWRYVELYVDKRGVLCKVEK